MDRNDRERGGGPEEDDFAALLERSPPAPAELEPGRKISARVVGVTAEHVFLDLGTKGEGCVDAKEFRDADGNVSVGEGDVVEAYFAGTSRHELVFTTRIAGGSVGRAQLEDAWRSGIPVEGTVEQAVKGGFRVRIAGSLRAFCPSSQMDLGPAEGREELLGKHLRFRITRYEEAGRNIVVSRRVLLEEERIREREAMRKTLREGMTVKATITSVRDFGAFVRVGAIDGLIPASEVAWDRGTDIREALAAGREVEVAAVSLDWERERFTFSLKKTLADPWDGVEARYPPESCHVGRVTRLAPYGAFVALETGVEGLVHVSRLGGGTRIRHPRDAVREGEEIRVKVDSVEREKRRISLSPSGDEAEQGRAEEREEYRRYMAEPPRALGTLGEALKTKLEQKGGK